MAAPFGLTLRRRREAVGTPGHARMESLGYDLGRKAGLYAVFGISELWVIDAVNLKTRIHRDPTPDGYRYKDDLGPNDRLVPQASRVLAATLAGLELG